jgi:hypothetical protein
MLHLFEDLLPYKYKISGHVIMSPRHGAPCSSHSLVGTGGMGEGGAYDGQRSVVSNRIDNITDNVPWQDADFVLWSYENKHRRKSCNEWGVWLYKCQKDKIRSELLWVLMIKFYSKFSEHRIREANFSRYESAPTWQEERPTLQLEFARA